MKVSDDLTALVFELQRVRSPADKARALARAWRTVRGLNATERRLLVREVGFDGAEELIEGLAGKSGGTFAPAALLEALGKMRKERSFSLRGIITDLLDPETREDLLARGIDFAADSIDPEDEVVDEAPVMDEPVAYDMPTAQPIVGLVHREADSNRVEVEEDNVQAASSGGTADHKPPVILPPPPSIAQPPTAPETAPDPEPSEPSPWDDPWRSSPVFEPAEAATEEPIRRIESARTVDLQVTTGSVLDRLRSVRNAIPEMRNAGPREIRKILEMLPELWARRRAVVELIDAGVPAGVGETLDLIEELDRPLDRRWCLAALARRGDLEGGGLERALAMLTSAAARRRVEALASRAR